jgi:hypothetical protein
MKPNSMTANTEMMSEVRRMVALLLSIGCPVSVAKNGFLVARAQRRNVLPC